MAYCPLLYFTRVPALTLIVSKSVFMLDRYLGTNELFPYILKLLARLRSKLRGIIYEKEKRGKKWNDRVDLLNFKQSSLQSRLLR